MKKFEKQEIVLRILELFSQGAKYRTVTSTIKDEYNLSEGQLTRCMNSAFEVLRDDTDNKISTLKDINLNRLETIIESSMKANTPTDLRVAITAIQEQSKLYGSYSANEADKLLANVEYKLKLDLPDDEQQEDD